LKTQIVDLQTKFVDGVKYTMNIQKKKPFFVKQTNCPNRVLITYWFHL